MRSLLGIALVGVIGLGGCAISVGNTEGLLEHAGFRKVPATTPQQVQHLQTVAPRKLIRRQGDKGPYYIYADPSYCKCMYVGSPSDYSTYKQLVRNEEEAMALEEQREEENVQGGSK